MRLSKDMLVAITIHKYQPVIYTDLVRIMKGIVDEIEIPPILASLSSWGITETEYRFNGRVYMISPDADIMISETRELWEEEQKKGSIWWRIKKKLRL